MQTELLFPFITYAIVTTITPGPNNITSTSAGGKLGYLGSLPYLAGITTGFYLTLLLAGLLTGQLLTIYNDLLPYLKWIGFSYMFWLAIAPFYLYMQRHTNLNANQFTFLSGLLLQLVNVKGILYAITIYSAFNPLIGISTTTVLASSLFLGFIGFCCV